MPEAIAEKKSARLLFNNSGMAYLLRPDVEGGPKVVFAVKTAFMPRDIMYGKLTEEQALLDYPGVMYADKMMTPTKQAEDLAAAKRKVEELTAENAELRKIKDSLAAGSGQSPAPEAGSRKKK